MHREGVFVRHRLDTLALLAAGGTPLAQGVIGPVPEGYCWYIEAIGFSVVGNSHTAVPLVAVTPDGGPLPAAASWDGQGLVWTPSGVAAVRGSENAGHALYVGPGRFAHAVLLPGTLAAGDAATFTFQVAVHELNPRFLMSREEADLVREAHERLPEHPVAEVATAGERAI
jgi:hypothetical protein